MPPMWPRISPTTSGPSADVQDPALIRAGLLYPPDEIIRRAGQRIFGNPGDVLSGCNFPERRFQRVHAGQDGTRRFNPGQYLFTVCANQQGEFPYNSRQYKFPFDP